MVIQAGRPQQPFLARLFLIWECTCTGALAERRIRTPKVGKSYVSSVDTPWEDEEASNLAKNNSDACGDVVTSVIVILVMVVMMSIIINMDCVPS